MSSTTSEPSVAELIKQLSEQSSRLARQEGELAKAELGCRARTRLRRRLRRCPNRLPKA